MLTCLGLAISLLALEIDAGTQAGASASRTESSLQASEPRAGSEEILIIGIRLRGDAVGNVPPVRRIGEHELGTYGASNVKDLVERLEPETRGNGSGASSPQIVLLNGSRIASFSDIGGLPVEAVERVDILPEEVALSYGYPVGARVLNIVLRERFRAVTADTGVGRATGGGRETISTAWNFARVRGATRFTADLSASRDSALDETERSIVADPSSARFIDGPAGSYSRGFSTLLPATSRASLGASLARPLVSRAALTVSGALSTIRSRSSFGRSGSDNLSFDGLRRELETSNARLSALVSGDLGLWRWSATATGERNWSTTRDRGAGYPDALPPSAPSLPPSTPQGSAGARETSFRSRRDAVDLTLSGPLAYLSTGQVLLSLAASVERLGFSPRVKLAGPAPRDLRRTHASLAASLDAPLARADSGLGSVVGNLNATVRHIPRFGSLRTFGAGLRWTPVAPLSLNFTYTDDDGFPSLSELGEPLLAVPDVLVFDPATGQSSSVTRFEGGNPLLRPNNRRERKIEAILRPPGVPTLTASANYSEVDLENPIATFPIVSPELEIAFPDRFQRDSAGRLISVDARSISVASSHFRGVRWGLQYASRPGPAGQSSTRFGAGLFHTLRFRNDIRTSATGPVLDLLDGAAVGPRGGVPRHLVEGNFRISNGPFGASASVTWQKGTTVRAGSGAGDLFYSDDLRLNAWLFVNFAQWSRASSLPSWVRSGRLTIAIENALDTHLRVRNGQGLTPIAFQPNYLDPLGRAVRLSFRTTIF